MIGRVLIPGAGWGRNLDAFNDISSDVVHRLVKAAVGLNETLGNPTDI